jgi:TRAP-type C4-dicarboxylate transport system substrate-binding protein
MQRSFKKLFFCALLTLCLFLGATAGAGAANYTFTFTTHSTPNSFQGSLQKKFFDEVERLTHGQVTFKVFWGGSLLKGNEVLKAVNDGVVDAGLVNINFYAKQLQLSNCLNTIQESSGSFQGMLEFFNRAFAELPELRQELAKYNNAILSVYPVMDYSIASTKPMAKLSDIKGLKCRSAARWLLPLFTELGATPVSVPWADCTMALQTNVIDAVYSNLDSINMVKMEDVAPNILLLKGIIPSTPFLLTINSKKYDALPDDIKAKLKEAGVNAQKSIGAEYEKWFAAIREAQTKAGYKVTVASPEDLAAWQSLKGLEANKKQWIEEATKDGVPNAEAFLASVYKLFDESKTRAK